MGIKYYFGVDSGGTKTIFVLSTESGQQVYSTTKGSTYFLTCGFETLASVMESGLQECLQASGVLRKEISHAFVSSAGYTDSAYYDKKIEAVMEQVFAGIPYTIGNDIENGHAGALAGHAGISVVAGTGSIAYGVDSTGQCVRSGGWTEQFGCDEGSGYWIASQLIREFTRQSDGRSKKTALYKTVKEELCFVADNDILQVLFEKLEGRRDAIASLSKIVHKLALLGDPVALDIFERAAVELADLIFAVYQQLHLERKEHVVSYTGGVFRAGSCMLDPLAKQLQKKHLVLQKPLFGPHVGAIILAAKYAGAVIDSEFLQNLQDSF